MASFLKKNKRIIIWIVVIVILLLAGALLVKNLFFFGGSGTLYGNRLDGIENVKLKDDTLKNIISEIEKVEQVTKASQRLEGKILNFSIDVSNGMTVEGAKKLVDPILSSLTEEELAFYDIQVIITCSENEESDIYPIMGYKHRTSSDFVW